MESLVGKTIGSYQIISEIGRGGMAMVYKAYHPTLERYVALKVLPPQFAFDTDFVKRFLLEARAAARLKHPNIVTIYDVGEQNGLYYIVMELVEGGSLAQLIQREGQLAPARAANILAQVASALDYAHALGFVHRDVKPSNILIGANDHATLTDFGIVKAAEGTRVTRTGTMMGTPEYMSPEQIRGQPVDGRADIYALGIVCYEMLAGRVPFAGDTARVLYGQVHETPPPLAINSRALRTVEQALAGALAKDPHQRYARASDFSNALNRVASGIAPLPASRLESPTRVEKRTMYQVAKRRQTPALVLLGIALLVILLVLWAYAARANMLAIEATATAQFQATNVALAGMTTTAQIQETRTVQAEKTFANETRASEATLAAQIRPTLVAIAQMTATAQEQLTMEAIASNTARVLASKTANALETATVFAQSTATSQAVRVKTARAQATLRKYQEETATAEIATALANVRATGTTQAQKTISVRVRATATAARKQTLIAQGLYKEVQVESDRGWQDTNFTVQSGATLIISYISGKWSQCAPKFGYGCPYTDANGVVDQPNWPDNVISNCNHIALIARISEGEPFCVGSKLIAQFGEAGSLQFRPNDKVLTDNDGVITVQVEIQ